MCTFSWQRVPKDPSTLGYNATFPEKIRMAAVTVSEWAVSDVQQGKFSHGEESQKYL